MKRHVLVVALMVLLAACDAPPEPAWGVRTVATIAPGVAQDGFGRNREPWVYVVSADGWTCSFSAVVKLVKGPKEGEPWACNWWPPDVAPGGKR